MTVSSFLHLCASALSTEVVSAQFSKAIKYPKNETQAQNVLLWSRVILQAMLASWAGTGSDLDRALSAMNSHASTAYQAAQAERNHDVYY